ncbi:uncharacterized protein LOC109543039 [Dendroctonus ponderosae]|uniref:uncharacterized protein LOC109543039 n=1 Tax=Dendroctonus ponderosae TaxID=77166 RepID=UPI002035E6E1|nr:uncharacterized protein LOC109543039 [Dendroctonus ponderosae]KAH1018280.1 hypothetical protein HUJ05_006081 [Dendroctonus ponderosae]
MPLLLARQLSSGSLAAIVEKCQRQPSQSPPPDYELQLSNSHLDLLLLSKPPKLTLPSDEGFESDIDTISLLSSENETFAGDKLAAAAPLTETDSANGGSGTESETETEKTNTLTQKNVNCIKEGLEKQAAVVASSSSRESFDLGDCICYADVNYPDVLVFVIKQEALVFKFANLEKLQTFYTNFTTLKAVANQRAYSASGLGKQSNKYNLLQRTDHNGVTHIEIKKQPNVASIQDAPKRALEAPQASPKGKDVNTRQRAQSKLISDVKFNTVGPKPRIVRSSSIENILHIDRGHLVKGADTAGGLRKVWNSAEDLLDSDSPRRPERRRKKKPAPPPPQPDKAEDVLSGQFVRVNVHVDPLQHARLVAKSTANEPHPKKLSQNFNLLGKALLRAPKPETATLNRPQRVPLYEKHHSWTNSVPRILKKSSRSKSETRCSPQSLQPMAYRYIDASRDSVPFPCPPNQNNAMFLNATGLKSRADPLQGKQIDPIQHHPRISFGYNVPGGISKHPMGNRVFGLTPKLKDFSRGETPIGPKWGSASDLTYLGGDRNNLKSSIKSGEPAGRKKNEKKVTFSAYTTVQVV